MGDADDSYDFSEADRFVKKFREGFELVMGCRLPVGGGTILPGAMPWKNRWLGNPVLSFIGRLFFKCPAHDFHCGLRGFTKAAFEKMELQTTGMEFASEMVIKATLKRLQIAEVPVTLHPDGRSRPPHLKPWRDGWRHLRFMLLFSPRWLFLVPGICFWRWAIVLAAALSLNDIRSAGCFERRHADDGVHGRHRRLSTGRVRVLHQGVCHRRGAVAGRPEIFARVQVLQPGKRDLDRPARAAGGTSLVRAGAVDLAAGELRRLLPADRICAA